MTRALRALSSSLLSLCLILLSFAQSPDQAVKIKTNEVLLDVTAQDKKGRAVRDLRLDEIEVYEDGVKQTVSKFALVGDVPKSDSVKPAGPGAAPPAATAQLNLVTMIFDHLPVQRVQQMRDAGYNFIDNSLTSNVLVRVMVVGRKLYLIEQFTNDRAKLRKAVERATNTIEKAHAEQSKRIAIELENIAAETSPLSAITESINAPTSPQSLLAKLSLDTLNNSEKVSQEVKSNLHVFSLLPFARAHRMIPGRKMAVYFSDGLYMPSGMTEALRTLVSEANLANLTFYALNYRNLPVSAGNQVSRLETATVVNSTRRPESSTFNGAVGDSFSTSDRVEGRGQINTNFNMFESVDRKKELNKQSPLAELTEGTGGFQITNLNDLNGAMKKVAVEMGNYYAVSYQPTRQEYDGKFRSITIKILRPGVRASSRSGYFAVPPSVNKRPELSYEAPLLAALHDAIVPNSFPFQAGTLHFESQRNETRTAVVASFPMSAFINTQSAQSKDKTYPLRFAFLGMVKDDKGEIVHRFSEPIQVEIPAANVESIRQSAYNLTRHFELPAGKYTLEIAAHDQTSNKLSAQRHIFNVASPRAGLQTGSMFLVKQSEPIDQNSPSDPDNPLTVANNRIIPELADTISATNRKELSFHLAIFPDTQSAAKPALTLELLNEGKTVATISPELASPDERGRIAFTAGIPTNSLPSGKYQFRAITTQAGATAAETLKFTVTDSSAKAVVEAEEKTITSALTVSDKVGAQALAALKAFKPTELSTAQLLPDIAKSGGVMYSRLGDYTYSLRKVRRMLTAKGKIKSEEYQDYEAYPVKGKHALIQLAENGSRLAVTLIDLNRRHATNELIKNETDSQSSGQSVQEVAQKIGYWGASIEGSVQKRGQPRRNVFITIDPEVFFNACEFTSPRVVLLEGRETIVLDFRPRADAKFEQDKDWIQKLNGTVWVDAAERTLVRIEGVNSTSLAVNEGAEAPLNFVYQQQRLAEGIWGPSLIRINSGGDETLFRGLTWDAWFEFTNFKRFDARDSDIKIHAPVDKQKGQ
ncbi:MAG: VWA domain-containing protein [Blastocatellia bacterium]